MKRLFSVLALVVFTLGLSACGGAATDTMTGNWVASITSHGYTVSYTLAIDDANGRLSGVLRSSAAGYTADLGSFSGTRSGNQVTLSFGSWSMNGTLSGRNLVFGSFQGSSLTFTKQ